MTAAMMTVDDFLGAKHIDSAAFFAQVQTELNLRADEFLIAVGSLVEGMGTSKSDIDLILITPVAKRRQQSGDVISLIVYGCLIDVRVLPMQDVDTLMARFAAWAQSAWDVMHAAKFTLDERTLLHRLVHGRALNSNRQQSMRQLPSRNDLARLKLHVARQMSRTIQVDMAGYCEVGDYRSLVFAAQEVLGHASDALAAGYELTNPLIKWRSKLLELIPLDWEQAFPARHLGLSAAERVWSLCRLPDAPAPGPAIAHALRITAFARAAFVWAEHKLVNGAIALTIPDMWSQVKRTTRGDRLPHLDLDVDVVMADEFATVGRLNDWGETRLVAPATFRTILLFDGVTTVQEAAQVAWGSSSKVSQANVKSLVLDMLRAGFARHWGGQ
jgi:hypothetical protein